MLNLLAYISLYYYFQRPFFEESIYLSNITSETLDLSAFPTGPDALDLKVKRLSERVELVFYAETTSVRIDKLINVSEDKYREHYFA